MIFWSKKSNLYAAPKFTNIKTKNIFIFYFYRIFLKLKQKNTKYDLAMTLTQMKTIIRSKNFNQQQYNWLKFVWENLVKNRLSLRNIVVEKKIFISQNF